MRCTALLVHGHLMNNYSSCGFVTRTSAVHTQELEGALRRRASNAVLEQLTSKFYTVRSCESMSDLKSFILSHVRCLQHACLLSAVRRPPHLQVIPHAFGFKRPTTLNTLDAVNAKVQDGAAATRDTERLGNAAWLAYCV